MSLKYCTLYHPPLKILKTVFWPTGLNLLECVYLCRPEPGCGGVRLRLLRLFGKKLTITFMIPLVAGQTTWLKYYSGRFRGLEYGKLFCKMIPRSSAKKVRRWQEILQLPSIRLLRKLEKIQNALLISSFWKQISMMAVHVGSRLIIFLSVVSNFFLVLSVVGSIFRPLSLVG